MLRWETLHENGTSSRLASVGKIRDNRWALELEGRLKAEGKKE